MSALRQLWKAATARVRAALLSPLGALALAAFLADRLSKFWVVEVLDAANRPPIDVWPPYLRFILSSNTGINFGLLSGFPEEMRWVLTVLAVAISGALVWWVRRSRGKPGWKVMAAGAGLVVGGALSNAWDRVQYGAVIDFLNMSCCGIVNPYAFNIADVAIFAGAALIAWKA